MACSLPLVAPNIFILKLKLHCTRCENKLKRLLSNAQGVQSVLMDSKQGTVTISGTVDPATIVTLLGTVGRKAEVLWEQRPSADNDQNLQIIAQSKVVNHQFNDPDVVAQLQQLSGIKGLKNVEVTYSKTVRLTLKGHQNDSDDKNVEITIRDGVQSPQIISHSGRLCTASSSCCGGHGAVNRNLHGSCGCCQIHAVGHPHWATHGCGCIPPGPPPPWPGYSPSAPPMGLVYDLPPTSPGPPPPPPPPEMGYSFSSFLSDDSPSGGCKSYEVMNLATSSIMVFWC